MDQPSEMAPQSSGMAKNMVSISSLLDLLESKRAYIHLDIDND